MDQINQEIVDKIKNKIISKSEKVPFSQTRLGIFLNTDWLEYIIDRMLYKKEYDEGKQSTMQMTVLFDAKEGKSISNSKLSESAPQLVEQDKEGNIYYTYENDIVMKQVPKYVFESVFPSSEVQKEVIEYLNYLDEIELDNRKKKLFASYLGLSEEEITELSWESIDEAILSKYIKTHRWKKKSLVGDRIC